MTMARLLWRLLGGGRFLMSEEPLYAEVNSFSRARDVVSLRERP